MKIGIRLGSLGTGSLKKDMQRTLAIGVHGIQLRVMDTEIDPRNLSASGREELADYIDSFGFEVSALSGELGGYGDSATVDERMARTRDMLDLCIKLRASNLTVDAGAVAEPGTRNYELHAGAVRELGQYALERNIRLAVTTGTEPIAQLSTFISQIKSEGLRINYDPAELCRRGFDPIADIKPMAHLVSHVQARDAVRGDVLSIGDERPLTHGEAQIEEAIAVVREGGYDGFLSVAWDRDDDLAKNAVEAVTWLQRQDGVDP
ncbi:MAG: sugar phosphate isomerase/epimerase [Candidatus Hydrogenedentes bacterium]|nr:sugar phosphate isomerase/epimerase [Candidatus Hydrogenedentota bacterium]